MTKSAAVLQDSCFVAEAVVLDKCTVEVQHIQKSKEYSSFDCEK